MTVDLHKLKADLLGRALSQGFELVGIAPATPAETRVAYEDWLAAGHAGEMHYLGRDPVRRTEPRRVWPDTGSVLVVGLNYRSEEPSGTDDPLRGQVARYAVGDDYHDVLVEKLKALLEWVTAETAGAVQGRYYVDTGPLLERDLARRAGLGWFGKNTMLLNRQQGSYFFLGALLLNVELPADEPVSAHCGSCSACLSACPTGALLSPYVLDARRCISYLTIELRGPIPRELRPLVGNWIFGCDLCQEVCPWNRKAAWSTEPAFQPRAALRTPELIPLLEMTQEEFSATFRRSPVKRTKRRGLLRNVCVALGNSSDPAAIPPLLRALAHEEPLVRGHAAWALGRLGAGEAAAELRVLAASDPDEWVREEAEAALGTLALPEARLAGVG